MHEIEPYYKWRDDYIASEDEYSPFYATEYSEFEFDKQIYNYLLHPQWDSFGSSTLYLKVLFADYERGYAIIELIGEWNDAINNDIMLMKRELLELMIDQGINKFILIGTLCHVVFQPSGKNAGKAWQYLKVEEWHYEKGVFKPLRTWNGDETDWGGPHFGVTPVVLQTELITR